MKKIPLTRGQFAIVDNDDYEWLSKFKWHASSGRVKNKFTARRGTTLKNRKNHVTPPYRYGDKWWFKFMNKEHDSQTGGQDAND